MIRQATANLISNAVRYTPRKAAISRCSVKQRRPHGFHRRAATPASGCRPRKQRWCSSRFWRADAGRDRESGGLGIGLAVVKEIVDRHGGWVQVEGRKNQGACFTIHIPLYDEAKARSKDRSQKQQKQQKQSSGRSGKIMSRDRKK